MGKVIKNNEEQNGHNPGTVVLQWLTYAFWGWTAIAILVLTMMILSYYMLNTDVVDGLPYSVAMLFVLLPIAVVCDLIYSKKEPVNKTGIVSIIMIVHAVLFALAGVGSLVVVVLNAVKLLITSGDTSNTQIYIYSGLIMLAVFVALLLRTIFPPKLIARRRAISIFMIVISVVLVFIGFAGPIKDSVVTKTDRLIDNNLSYVINEITSYVDINDKLPADLSHLEFNSSYNVDAKKLIQDNLVEYNITDDTPSVVEYSEESMYQENRGYSYDLCVVYVKEKSSRYFDSVKYVTEYSYYADTNSHPAGRHCYSIDV